MSRTVWCVVENADIVPRHAVQCGEEDDKALYTARSVLGHAHGKYAPHLNGSNVIAQDQMTESPLQAPQFEVLCFDGGPCRGYSWVAWAELIAAENPEDVVACTVPSGNGCVVARANFRGACHPAAGRLDEGYATVLWGGRAHHDVDTFDLLCSEDALPDYVPRTPATAHVPPGAFSDPLWCGPLRTIARLLQWAAGPELRHTPIAPRSASPAPRLLVCHDCGGSYTNGERPALLSPQSSTPYTLQHWAAVDTFVYFSHARVAVPPQEWIRAAHKHGVRCLGTFITEWDLGAEACRFFLHPDHSEEVVTQLGALAAHYGFDGWLINIENKVRLADIEALHLFVESLTAVCSSVNDRAQVLWYDSVTADDGLLQWQNCLNECNLAFFQRCSGIFCNYHWSQAHAKDSAKFAGSARRRDVYMGVDCFGRGTFLGGGLNSGAAVAAAAQRGLSSALFAPGWTLESQPSPVTRMAFLEKDEAMWRPICDAVAVSCGPAVTVHALPFRTTFCEAVCSTFSAWGQPCHPASPLVQLSLADPPLAALPPSCRYTAAAAFWGNRCVEAPSGVVLDVGCDPNALSADSGQSVTVEVVASSTVVTVALDGFDESNRQVVPVVPPPLMAALPHRTLWHRIVTTFTGNDTPAAACPCLRVRLEGDEGAMKVRIGLVDVRHGTPSAAGDWCGDVAVCADRCALRSVGVELRSGAAAESFGAALLFAKSQGSDRWGVVGAAYQALPHRNDLPVPGDLCADTTEMVAAIMDRHGDMVGCVPVQL